MKRRWWIWNASPLMNLLETIGTRVRHLPSIRRFDAFWRLVRPIHDHLVLHSPAGQGPPRRMNGMDDILLARFPQVSSDA